MAEQMCNMSCATSLVQHVIWPASGIQADLLDLLYNVCMYNVRWQHQLSALDLKVAEGDQHTGTAVDQELRPGRAPQKAD